MRNGTTFTGKSFHYDGTIDAGITVHTLDGNGKETNTNVRIDHTTIEFITDQIKRHGSIKMGACRDNPSKGSLGEMLQSLKKSPQFLSYVLPLLMDKGLISNYKEGRSYWVTYLH